MSETNSEAKNPANTKYRKAKGTEQAATKRKSQQPTKELKATKSTAGRTATRREQQPDKEPSAREGSKTSVVLDLLRRPTGATLAEIVTATNWQPHSVRGFLSGAVGKRMGLTIQSTRREDGVRVYQLD